MDNGEVITGLDEEWTLGGAKLLEWLAGFAALIIVSEMIFGPKMGKNMPILMVVWLGTTFGMAALRKRYPDEQRGLMNQCLISVGMAPPGIPRPAALQPVWSGAPVRELAKTREFVELGLAEVFELKRQELLEVDHKPRK